MYFRLIVDMMLKDEKFKEFYRDMASSEGTYVVYFLGCGVVYIVIVVREKYSVEK